MQKRPTYDAVQYLRALAAIAVVFGHAALPEWKMALYAGVDLFFIISGFVMVVSSTRRGPIEFLEKRALRVMPMWWVALFCAFALGLTWETNLLASAFLIPTLSDGSISHVAWSVGWTLILEAVFYLCFAIGLAIKKRWFIFLLIPLLTQFHGGYNPIFNAFTSPLLIEFLFGAAIGHAALKGMRFPAWLAILGAVLFVYGQIDGGARLWFTGLPLAMLFAGTFALKLPRLESAHFLGDASYSIYLFHLIAIKLAWEWLGVPMGSYWLATAAVGIALGCLAHVFIERPILARTNANHVANRKRASERPEPDTPFAGEADHAREVGAPR